MMTPRDPDREMIQIQQWWSRSRDDPDPVQRDDPDRVMIQIQLWWLREIQIERWSRSSSDDPDREMIQILSREMIQIERWSRSSPERWSRSSDDPDPVQWCWSRSSDDLDPVMPFDDDPDREMIQIQMTWRRRWLEDEDDLKTKMIQLMQRRRPVLKNCVERIPS